MTDHDMAHHVEQESLSIEERKTIPPKEEIRRAGE